MLFHSFLEWGKHEPLSKALHVKGETRAWNCPVVNGYDDSLSKFLEPEKNWFASLSFGKLHARDDIVITNMMICVYEIIAGKAWGLKIIETEGCRP